MAPNALPFVNLFANSHAAGLHKNVRQQFRFNNNNNGCVSASFQHRLKSIKDRFVAVNRPFLTEKCLEAVGRFSPSPSSDAENQRLDDARALTAARLELVREALVKRSVREKLEAWQKKKESLVQLRQRFADAARRPPPPRDLPVLEKEDYRLTLDEIQKRAARVVRHDHRQRAVEICFRATVAAAESTARAASEQQRRRRVDDAAFRSLESRLRALQQQQQQQNGVVGEPALIEAKRLLAELASYENYNALQVAPTPADVKQRCSLNKFSVNVPGDGLVKHVRRQYVALVKNNKTLLNGAAAAKCAPFADDPGTAAFRRNAVKVINTLVNTVSTCSAAHMADKRDRLDALLSGRPVRAADVHVMAGRNVAALAFCADALCGKIADYAERVACVNARAAHDMAAVVTELWAAHQRFGKALFAELKRRCPLLVPYCYPAAKGLADGQPDRLAFGYRADASGGFESDAKYLRRMTGIVRLYAALMVASLRRDRPPVVGLSQAWIFVAGTLNQNPVADVTATLLAEFLNVVGFAMHRAYGKQFVKMLRYIDAFYMKKIALVTPAGHGGPVTRLDSFVSKCLRSGSFGEPERAVSPDRR